MKILVISDSHGNKLGVDRIFKNMAFDYLLFLGDGLADIGDYKYLDNVYIVSGNCDFFSTEPNERVVELGGKKIFMTHGNKYGVKLGLGALVRRGVDLQADMVLYGHTHNRNIEQIGNIYYVNPGKFSKNSEGDSSGIEIDVDGDEIKFNSFKI